MHCSSSEFEAAFRQEERIKREAEQAREEKLLSALEERPAVDKPYEEMTVEELQGAILNKMANNGPVTDYMRRTVLENTHRGSLLNWVRSFR